MRSQIEHYLPFDEILLPEPYRLIEIPSWEAVIKPVLDGVLAHYHQEVDEEATELTDSMLKALNLPGVHSVAKLKQFAMERFQEREKEMKFQFDIFPYLLTFFATTTQTIINSEEADAYYVAMTNNYKEEAEQHGISYDQFLKNSFGLSSDQEEELRERIQEYFIFKLVAYARFGENHGQLDEVSYDAFIQQQVITQGVDEIELRDRLPFEVYKDIFPEILLTEELKNYFKNKIQFKIK